MGPKRSWTSGEIQDQWRAAPHAAVFGGGRRGNEALSVARGLDSVLIRPADIGQASTEAEAGWRLQGFFVIPLPEAQATCPKVGLNEEERTWHPPSG